MGTALSWKLFSFCSGWIYPEPDRVASLSMERANCRYLHYAGLAHLAKTMGILWLKDAHGMQETTSQRLSGLRLSIVIPNLHALLEHKRGIATRWLLRSLPLWRDWLQQIPRGCYKL